MKKNKLSALLIIPTILLSSCTVANENIDYGYFNNMCSLLTAGDLHGASPFSGVLLDRNEGLTNYTYLFDKSKSFVNFQCHGTSIEDFWCEGTVMLYDAKGDKVIDIDSFNCKGNIGLYYGTIYTEGKAKDIIGDIYVHTPYWCRFQYGYDVDGSGNEILLTFEFFKGEFNPLPDFMQPSS